MMISPKEHSELIELRAEEVLRVLTSIQELMLLADHYRNPPETKDFLVQMSICTNKLETIVQHIKTHVSQS